MKIFQLNIEHIKVENTEDNAWYDRLLSNIVTVFTKVENANQENHMIQVTVVISGVGLNKERKGRFSFLSHTLLPLDLLQVKSLSFVFKITVLIIYGDGAHSLPL